MAHTPGPWTVDKYSRIITPTREVLLVSGVALPNGIHPRIEEAEANAAYIVRACNAHEELVQALKHCEKVFRSMSDRGKYPEELLPFSVDPATPMAENPHFLGKQGLTFVLDAIAKAEGVKP